MKKSREQQSNTIHIYSTTSMSQVCILYPRKQYVITEYGCNGKLAAWSEY